jgi:NADPH-dependent curcumin reductase
MTESKNRRWILNSRPRGKLTGEEFRWNEAPVPKPSDGQMLIRTLWLSVDPAQRIWMARDSGENFGKQLVKVADAAV